MAAAETDPVIKTRVERPRRKRTLDMYSMQNNTEDIS
tara:strand:- start:142 stop:252 length:111 start_codon:yes stop_codon:yes gene_type:complete